MVMKKYRNIRNLGIMAGGSAYMGIIGSAMPGTTGAGLTGASTSLAGFVSPMATVTGAGMVLNATKQFPKLKRK